VCQTLMIGLEILPERLISKEVPSNAIERPSDSTAAIFARLSELKLNRPYWKLKRAIDFVVALSVAIMLLPLIAAVSVLVLRCRCPDRILATTPRPQWRAIASLQVSHTADLV
jgi:hypothetical protein